MRRIEIQLDDVTITARLLDDKAPKLCQALWDIMPIEDTVAHAQWSGAMFHTVKNDWLNFPVDYPWGLENLGAYQSPGDVVYFPPAKEFAVAYGDSQFCWVTGSLMVSTVAKIEGDLTTFAKKADRLQFDGAKKMIVRPKSEKEKTVEIEFDGVKVVAEFWPDKAPKLVENIWKSLPFEGQVTNTYWSGQMARLWVKIPEPEGPSENTGVLHFPGDILFVPGWNGLRFIYGQAQMRGPTGPHAVSKVGRIRGDLTEFAARANQIQYDGAKKFIVRRKE